MGSIFLDKFLKKLNESLNQKNLDAATVEIEKDTKGKGRIDIFIET